MDDVDRELLRQLQQDATTPYTALGKAAGLSAAAAHDRVRKLRERGVIRRTTIEVDPAAAGRGVLAFVMVDANAWMGDPSTREALARIAEIEEAHIVAGAASVLVKVRTASTEELQRTLRQIFGVDGVSGTDAIVVLETFFERPPTSEGVSESRRSVARAGRGRASAVRNAIRSATGGER